MHNLKSRRQESEDSKKIRKEKNKMESVLTPPLPFKFEENVTNMAFGSLCESWEKWKNGFQIYVKACELNKKTEEIQMNIFLHVVGEQCREIIEQSTTKCTTLAALIGQVDNHFKAKKKCNGRASSVFYSSTR